MSDVFDIAETGSDFFRDAALAAAFELDVFDRIAHGEDVAANRRLRRLLDVLTGFGVVEPPAQRPSPPAATGWGALADVIRRDQPEPAGDRDALARMHVHLAHAGARAAEETAQLVGSFVAPASLVDLGGGAGAYTRAFLTAHPHARATLVDVEGVIPLARDHLASLGDRVDVIAADIRDVPSLNASVALLANVLHLHGPATCAELVRAAARAIAPGGIVAVKDLRMDTEHGVRIGPLQSLVFALNMAVYTEDGDVHETALLRDWLAGAGLVDIEERRLASSPHAIVVMGRKL